jgi:pyruvate decarboxylase
MGKGAANETLPSYGGVYTGAGSHPDIKNVVESSDAVLFIGRYESDFNSGEFTARYPEDKTVEFQRFYVRIGEKKFDLKMKYLVKALVDDLKANPLNRTNEVAVTWDPYPVKGTSTGKLTQDFLWNSLGKFFRSGDLIIGETGTSAFGMANSKLPEGAFMYNQTIFGSIGYATGAALGSFTAMEEDPEKKFKRGILITGEGSLHLTIQAFADFLRRGLRPIM